MFPVVRWKPHYVTSHCKSSSAYIGLARAGRHKSIAPTKKNTSNADAIGWEIALWSVECGDVWLHKSSTDSCASVSSSEAHSVENTTSHMMIRSLPLSAFPLFCVPVSLHGRTVVWYGSPVVFNPYGQHHLIPKCWHLLSPLEWSLWA